MTYPHHPDTATPDRSVTPSHLAAVARDLELAATSLRELATSPNPSRPTPVDPGACRRAEAAARRVLMLLSRLRRGEAAAGQPATDSVRRLVQTAGAVVRDGRGRRRLLPGSDPLMDDLEEALVPWVSGRTAG